ncbi:hypothetical protein H7X46_08835 [Pseudonocardia sp. C8]|uniref:hypothetical protein n=1 Tax=Pseudonocardia sp. C8 TaxID=2762759 RepID=UPI001643519D|nr:hypothetical protein [Pseudonocardia sp. C8]MBC3191164.1 hypothetical protein [Pseudonocardia sp. C8]
MTTPTAPAVPAAPQPGQQGVTDLLGHPLADHERALLEVYTGLVETLSRDDLPPCVAANLRAALAPVAVAVTDLGLRFEHLTDLGV